jgi:hypothetical protein
VGRARGGPAILTLPYLMRGVEIPPEIERAVWLRWLELWTRLGGDADAPEARYAREQITGAREPARAAA